LRSRSFHAAVVLFTLLVVAAILWAHPSSSDFMPANPYWNGLRQAAREFGVVGVASLDRLPEQARGTALVVIPYVEPSPADLDLLERYVDGGGVLILMDDFGAGNAILAHLGVSARLVGQALVDPLFHHRNPRFPRVDDFAPGPLAEGVGSLVLNHATAIAGAAEMTVAALSSPVSYVDNNGNGRRDAGEPGGPHPVVAVGQVGTGSLVIVSDPSILLNSMLDLGDNRRFAQNVFNLAGAGARVYLDEARLERAPLDQAKLALAGARSIAAHPLVMFAAAGAVLALALLGGALRK
jgi:hypothetical protein